MEKNEFEKRDESKVIKISGAFELPGFQLRNENDSFFDPIFLKISEKAIQIQPWWKNQACSNGDIRIRMQRFIKF